MLMDRQAPRPSATKSICALKFDECGRQNKDHGTIEVSSTILLIDDKISAMISGVVQKLAPFLQEHPGTFELRQEAGELHLSFSEAPLNLNSTFVQNTGFAKLVRALDVALDAHSHIGPCETLLRPFVTLPDDFHIMISNH
jgi:hypothetical protein